MNEKIRQHVSAYNERNGWDSDEASIIDTIINDGGKHVWTGNDSPRRWWIDCFTVVEIDGMLIGFNNARTTGDDSPQDKGWEFDVNSICEVREKEITVTIYERVD